MYSVLYTKNSFGISMKPGAVVCTSLPDFRLNVAGSCIIERESITHFALLSAADALPSSVNKSANHQVTLRKQLNVSALTFIFIMIMYMNPYHLLLIKTLIFHEEKININSVSIKNPESCITFR